MKKATEGCPQDCHRTVTGKQCATALQDNEQVERAQSLLEICTLFSEGYLPGAPKGLAS